MFIRLKMTVSLKAMSMMLEAFLSLSLPLDIYKIAPGLIAPENSLVFIG